MGIGKWVYIAITSQEYPMILAVEMIDYLHDQKPRTYLRDNGNALADWCQTVTTRYNDIAPGSHLHSVMEHPGSWNGEYQQAVANYCRTRRMEMLQAQVDHVADIMHNNIQLELRRIPDLERLAEQSLDLMEQAQVFRKNARMLRDAVEGEHRSQIVQRGWRLGFVTIGAGTALATGGLDQPFLWAVSTLAENIVTQAIETVLGGLAGYFVASQITKAYYWSQRMIYTTVSGAAPAEVDEQE